MSNHSVLTCFKKKKALQAQIDSIEAAAKQRAHDELSVNLLILSHDDKRKRPNRARKSVSGDASEFSQPDLDNAPIEDSGVVRHKGAATRVKMNQASESAVYEDKGGYFSESNRYFKDVSAPKAERCFYYPLLRASR